MGSCGPSTQEQQLSSQSQSLSSLLAANYAQYFGAQSPILGNLSKILTPIFEAGPNQQGMSPAEKAARTGTTINTTAANYRNAAVAVAGSRAGGNTYAPSGADTQVSADIASRAAEQLSNEENQIEKENYEIGRSNFLNAETGLERTAAEYNPNAVASTAIGANNAAFGEAQANQAAEGALAQDAFGLLGGLGGAALGNPKLVHA